MSICTRLEEIAQKITLDILPAYGVGLVAEFDDPRQVDRALELQEQDVYSHSHTIDEIRAQYYEDDPIGDERGKMLPVQIGVSTPTGDSEERTPPQLLPFVQSGQPPQPETTQEEEPEEETEDNPVAARADLAAWRRKSLHALKAGKGAAVVFESAHIDPDVHADIWAQLSACKTAADVREVFEAAITGGSSPRVDADLVAELRRANDLLTQYTAPAN